MGRLPASHRFLSVDRTEKSAEGLLLGIQFDQLGTNRRWVEPVDECHKVRRILSSAFHALNISKRQRALGSRYLRVPRT